MRKIEGWEASNGHVFKHKRDCQREEFDILLQDYCEEGAFEPSVRNMIECMMAQPGAFITLLQDVQEDMVK